MDSDERSPILARPNLTSDRVHEVGGSPLLRPNPFTRDAQDTSNPAGGSRRTEPPQIHRRYHTFTREYSRTQSTQYHGPASDADVTSGFIDGVTIPNNYDDIKKINMKQSKPIPTWIWFILAKCLGIKLHQYDKPWFGTVMYVITLAFAILYIITSTWYTVYDILSIRTKQTVLTGSLSIVGEIYWCTLGIYANKLASKLFSNPRFVNIVRMHSKTFFKVSAAVLLILLGLVEVIIQNIQNKHVLQDNHCLKVNVNPVVCHLMFGAHVGYSCIMLLWNLLVGIVLLSVCRTHTIGIRRFIRDLEEDGRLYEQQRRQRLMASNFYDSHGLYGRAVDVTDQEDNTDWDMEQSDVSDDYQELSIVASHDYSSRSQRYIPPKHSIGQALGSFMPGSPHFNRGNAGNMRSSSSCQQTVRAEVMDNKQTTESGITASVSCPPIITVIHEQEADTALDGKETEPIQTNHSNYTLIQPDPPSQVSSISQADSNINSTCVEISSPDRVASPDDSMNDASSSLEYASDGPQILSNEDILMSYWKISARLRWSARILERWLTAWIILIIMFSCSYIVYWINHEATLLGILEFLIPILTLPLICCAYGEVNNEGQRMLKCICPTEKRVSLLFYLYQSPLAMTAFGFAINYSAIVTVLGALAVAFSTRIILEEISVK